MFLDLTYIPALYVNIQAYYHSLLLIDYCYTAKKCIFLFHKIFYGAALSQRTVLFFDLISSDKTSATAAATLLTFVAATITIISSSPKVFMGNLQRSLPDFLTTKRMLIG